MKVLVIATSPQTRGGITSVIKSHMQGRQWDEYNCIWISTHIDKSIFFKLLFLLGGYLRFLLNIWNTDIVHIHLSEPFSALRKCPIIFVTKLLSKKLIVHFHSFSTETTVCGKFKNVYRYLFTKADVIVVLSNYWKEKVNNEYSLGDKVKVIYNPCTIRENNKSYPKANYILYAGTVNQRKGYADLISAFAKVAPLHPDWFIVIAGNGELNRALELSRSLGIEEKVKLLGWVSGDSKDRVFKEASIFCLPSYAEGFPMAVLDAWTYGLPVITTPVGGIPDVAEDGENMLLFNPGDIDKLSVCIDNLIINNTLREKLSQESLKLSTTVFSINTITDQLRKIYMDLLASHL